MPAERGSTAGPLWARGSQPAPEPGSGSSGTQGSTFHTQLAPPQGSYQQFPGAPAPTLISAGVSTVLLHPQHHCSSLSSMPAVDQSTPWDTHSGMCHVEILFFQEHITAWKECKESLRKSNPPPQANGEYSDLPHPPLDDSEMLPGTPRAARPLHSIHAIQD